MLIVIKRAAPTKPPKPKKRKVTKPKPKARAAAPKKRKVTKKPKPKHNPWNPATRDKVKGLGRIEPKPARPTRGRGRAAIIDAERADFEAIETAVKVKGKSRRRHACKDRVQASRAKGRAEVERARELRKARNERAKRRCETVRTHTKKIEGAAIGEIRAERAAQLSKLRKELFAKKPRTRRQELGDAARARKARARPGVRVAERIDFETQEIPSHLQKRFRKEAKLWLKKADQASARRGRKTATGAAAEMFMEAVGGHDRGAEMDADMDAGEREMRERYARPDD